MTTSGSVERFVGVVRRHDPSLRALAYRMLGDAAMVDDVLQEAYLNAFRTLDRFEARSTMRTWLHRIVYNACVDELRRPRLVQLDRTVTPADDTAISADQVAAKLDLAQALMRLPPEQRAAMWLVGAEGFTHRETAEVLDVPVGTVSAWVSRGQRRRSQQMSAGREARA